VPTLPVFQKIAARIRLPEQLALPMLALMLAGMAASATLVNLQTNQLLRTEAQHQLVSDRHAAQGWLNQYVQRMTACTQLGSRQAAWGPGLDGQDVAGAQTALNELARQCGLEWAALINEQGEAATPLGEHPLSVVRGSADTVRTHARQPGDFMVRHNGVTEWIWSVPVQSAATGAKGTLLLARALDANWLKPVRELVRNQLVLLHRDRADGAWEFAPNARIASLASTPWPPREGPSNQSLVKPLTLADQEWLTNTLPLSGDSVRSQAALALLLDPGTLHGPWQDTALMAALIMAGALIIGVTMAWMAGQRISAGMRLLTKWAMASIGMEFPAPPPMKGTAELVRLGLALDAQRKHFKERDAETRQTAFKDPLTLLSNREQLRQKLQAVLGKAGPNSREVAVIVLDLQRFKYINEVLGYANGDRLLRLLAQRLTDDVQGKHDVLARVGGNAFAVVLPLVEQAAAEQRLRDLLKCIEQPFDLDGQSIDLRASAGLAMYPAHGSDGNLLLARAEIAMFFARRKQAIWLSYEPSMDAADPHSLSLLSDLKLAIERQELRLYLQPKVDLRSGFITGAESLLRWQHPKRGMVPPDRFIPFAEQAGFIGDLSMWVVEETVRWWRHFQAAGLNLKLSVNLSARDLIDKELPHKLLAIVQKHAANPAGIVLEITESATMDDPEHARQILMRLHQMGFLLSIDDFGTGYSSLAYLKNLPVDELKIDRSFVMNMERDVNDAKIVRSTIELAHNLGLRVVAEGLESDKTWKILSRLNCDQAQGYLINCPIPAETFAQWASEWVPPDVAEVHLSTSYAELTSIN
jgi:diguanylate cyclase